jgi:hypothetical protein
MHMPRCMKALHVRWHNRRMRRRGSIQALLWSVACTLMLKAAVPLLAAGAAHLQGVPVGSICGIYGVTLPGVKADPHAHHHSHQGEHGEAAPSSDAPAHSSGSDRNHCALTGLAAMAVPDLAALPVRTPTPAATAPPRIACMQAGDACAAWTARMQHPPPARA